MGHSNCGEGGLLKGMQEKNAQRGVGGGQPDPSSTAKLSNKVIQKHRHASYNIAELCPLP